MDMERFKGLPIVGIMRGASTERLLPAAKAGVEAGLRTLEVTLNRPEAFEQIKTLRSSFGKEVAVGAGTVLSKEQAEKAIAAGAEFIVTPALVPAVIQACREKAVPVFPGAMTPTVILAAYQAGAAMVKVFPAGALGPSYIKSLRGPFPDIPLMPTGGVALESVAEYFRAGANALGIGGEIFKKEWLEQGDLKAVAQAAEAFVKATRAAIK